MPNPIDTEGIEIGESVEKNPESCGKSPEPAKAKTKAPDGLPLDLSDLSDEELARLERDALGDLERQGRMIGRGIKKLLEDEPRQDEGFIGQALRVFGLGK